MKTQLVIMLTHNDLTVKNAGEVFDECKDLPISCWGFKDVGIPVEQMKEVNKAMKDAGKTTFLEVVTYTEEECLNGAKMAMDCGFDYLTGTVFYPSIVELLKGSGVKYFPFGGKVSGSPIQLEGTTEEIVADCLRLLDSGADGVDLTPFRHKDKNFDGSQLASAAVTKIPSEKLMFAGSIGTFERMDEVNKLEIYGYTMGSALFDGKFVKGGTFRENLEFVLKHHEKE